MTFAARTDTFAGVAKADRTAQHVKTLADRVRGLDAVFSCGAAVTLPDPIELRFHGQRRVQVSAGPYGDETRLARRLTKECAPAPFGVGSDTRRDPRVRRGDQLLAHDGALSVVGLDLVETGILEDVRRALCPGAARLPDAELYALNVYTRDGHFVRHKDTPRDRACFGTLVVCLPLRFRGGRLVLRQESTRIYAWESHWGRRDKPYELKWAAFYGDVDHEIEPVTDGTRATLTWLLRSADDDVVTPPPPAATEVDGNTRRGLTARCRRDDGSDHVVAVSEVAFPEGSEGARHVAAYRMWMGIGPLPAPKSARAIRRKHHKATAEDLDPSAPVELIVLAPKQRAARCRLLGTERQITLRSRDVWRMVPGEIVTVRIHKQWQHRGHPYLSGEVKAQRLDIEALGLVPLRLEDEWLWDPAEHYWGAGARRICESPLV